MPTSIYATSIVYILKQVPVRQPNTSVRFRGRIRLSFQAQIRYSHVHQIQVRFWPEIYRSRQGLATLYLSLICVACVPYLSYSVKRAKRYRNFKSCRNRSFPHSLFIRLYTSPKTFTNTSQNPNNVIQFRPLVHFHHHQAETYSLTYSACAKTFDCDKGRRAFIALLSEET